MGIRQLPFFKPRKGWQMAGDGLDTGGGDEYELPTASADTLGGVKVGSGLSINDGVLSVDSSESLVASVNADGVKSYRTLLGELFASLPQNFDFKRSGYSDGTIFLNASTYLNGEYRYGGVRFSDSLTTVDYVCFGVMLSNTANNCQFKRTNNNEDLSNTVPSSGVTLSIYYI